MKLLQGILLLVAGSTCLWLTCDVVKNHYALEKQRCADKAKLVKRDRWLFSATTGCLIQAEEGRWVLFR